MTIKKPWEEGYEAPPETMPMSKVDAGRMGGFVNKARRKAGLPAMPPKKSKPGPVSDPNSAYSQRAEWENEDNISLKRRAMLDNFTREYLYDFNAPMAYIRAGGAESHAVTGGHQALKSAYVQQQLRLVTDILEEEELLTRKDIILGLKKEANYKGDDSSQSARVRAWSALAKIKGMEIQKVDTTVTHKGGIMLVPMAANLNVWENNATDSQAQLKHEVRK